MLFLNLKKSAFVGEWILWIYTCFGNKQL